MDTYKKFGNLGRAIAATTVMGISAFGGLEAALNSQAPSQERKKESKDYLNELIQQIKSKSSKNEVIREKEFQPTGAYNAVGYNSRLHSQVEFEYLELNQLPNPILRTIIYNTHYMKDEVLQDGTVVSRKLLIVEGGINTLDGTPKAVKILETRKGRDDKIISQELPFDLTDKKVKKDIDSMYMAAIESTPLYFVTRI